MNIILMTIILTLLGAGLVTLLVWLSVVSCKSIKLQKEQKNQISNLDVYISDNLSSIYNYIDDKFKDLNMEQNERDRELGKYKDEVSDNLSNIYNYIDGNFKDLNMEQNERDRELGKYKDEVSNQYCKNFDTIQALSKNVDSRLDKLHSAINSINVQIADNKSDNK